MSNRFCEDDECTREYAKQRAEQHIIAISQAVYHFQYDHTKLLTCHSVSPELTEAKNKFMDLVRKELVPQYIEDFVQGMAKAREEYFLPNSAKD